jgi:hypothetical protein
VSTQLRELAAHRQALVARSDALRIQLADSTHGLQQLLGVADLGVAAGRSLTRAPLLLAAIGVALLVFKPRPALRALSFALAAIPVLRQVRRFLSDR